MKRQHRRRFRVIIIAQVALLMTVALLLAWTLLESEYTAVPAVLVIVMVLQVIALLRTVESHVETLEDFFAAVNYEDFTRRYIEDDVDAELKEAFNRVLERFQDALTIPTPVHVAKFLNNAGIIGAAVAAATRDQR